MYSPSITISLLSVILLITCYFTAATTSYPQELMNSEHFDDIVYEADGSMHPRFDAFIAFYSNSCERKLNQLGYDYSGVPTSNYVLLMRYNDQERHKQAWHQWKDYDLLARYRSHVTSCPTIMYFPPNDFHNPQIFDNNNNNNNNNENDKFSTWAWEKLSMSVTFVNHHSQPVDILFVNNNNNRQPSRVISGLQPQQRQNLRTFVSHRMIAVDSNTQAFINGWDMRRNMSQNDVEIVPLNAKNVNNVDSWHKYITRILATDEQLVEQELWSHARRHIMFIKQVPLVPPYTELGYAKMPQPPQVFHTLKQYYLDHYHERKIENWSRGATQINFDFVKTAMIYLPEDMKTEISAIIQPILEEWSQQKLIYQMMYGIREYYNGSILRKHVDRLETHVISVILNVAQDVEEDWVLEVVDFNGNNVKIPQKAGEMVLYESARLQHGRPYPLKGKLYASAFLHFMPAVGWDGIYTFTDDNVIHINNEQHIPLRPESILGRPFVGKPKPTLRSEL